MTSAYTQALIEEARRERRPFEMRLADALEVSEAARKDLADKIEAAMVQVGSALQTYDVMKDSVTGVTRFDWGHIIRDLREAQRLLGLVSGDSKERSDGRHRRGAERGVLPAI